jgi:hypothetical protein
MQSINEKIILFVLILLALSNLIFFIVSSYSGPIIGFITAIVIAIHWWQKRNSRLIMIMAIVWILIHIYELIELGISSYPVIISLNLLLPILLFYCSLKAYLQMKKEEK